MKHLFLFLAVFYPLFQTCYGKPVTNLNVVFVNAADDPNDKEIETLANLMAHPMNQTINKSLMTHFGLMTSYSIILSSNPDRLYSFKALDMDLYSEDYFLDLARHHAVKSEGSSFKGLRKAVEISSEPSIILMATNKKPSDTFLLMEILEAMVAKTNPVIIFQIKDDGSISQLNKINMDVNMNKYIPPNVAQNNQTLLPEFRAILEVSENVLDMMIFNALTTDTRHARVDHELKNLLKLNYSFEHPVLTRRCIFVFDMTNATETQLDTASQSMKTEYHTRDKSPYNITQSYSILFSHDPDTIYPLEKSTNYTAGEFRSMLEDRRSKNGYEKRTLKGLLKALQEIPPFSWIVYYVNGRPRDQHELLPQIIQLIFDKKAQVKLVSSLYGELSTGNVETPLVFKTILDASKIVMSKFYVSTNWIETMDIFKHRQTENAVVSKYTKNETVFIRSVKVRVVVNAEKSQAKLN